MADNNEVIKEVKKAAAKVKEAMPDSLPNQVEIILPREDLAKMVGVVVLANVATVGVYHGGRRLLTELQVRREMRKLKKQPDIQSV